MNASGDFQVITGPGTRVVKTGMGFAVGAASTGGGSFKHPWRPFLTISGIKFDAGVVNGLTPVIATGDGSIPMSGDPAAGQTQPTLPLDASVADPATLESWACLEVTPKSNGTLDNTCLIQIVHRNSPFSTNPLIGRQPLALIIWANQKPGQVFAQIRR